MAIPFYIPTGVKLGIFRCFDYSYSRGWASQVALVVKSHLAHEGDIKDRGLIPGLARSPGEGHGNPLQCSCLENPMDRGAWQATVYRVAQTQLKWLSMLAHAHSRGIYSSTSLWFICTSMMTNDVEHAFMHLLAIHISSLMKCLFRSLSHF